MTDWDQQFRGDIAWQERLRDLILKPRYYEQNFGSYEFIRHTDERAKDGVDTIADGLTFDEKIVRWPRDDCGPYSAFAFETMSCTVAGRERQGWMVTNHVDVLLYCFSNKNEHHLDCYAINFAYLQMWFAAVDHDQWPLWTSTQLNRTQCRIVPIAQVCEAVSFKRHRLTRPPYFDEGGRFIHHCEVCGADAGHGFGVSLRKHQLGTWYCKEHLP